MKRNTRKGRNPSVLIITLCCLAVALLLLNVWMLVSVLKQRQPDAKPEQTDSVAETSAETETAPTETTLPPETEPQILPYFRDMVAENPDMVGWIRIDNTKLDYPLMYSPGDNEKYLHKGFDGSFDVGGLPFVDEKCSWDPASDNLIIYGHNMKNGTMFKTIMDYDQKAFWEAHPVVHMSTLYEETEYEIIAAFYDRVYYKYEDCFKFYQFVDAEDEEHFNEAIDYFKSHSLYDTGVTAQYGDKLITLVTCAYHVDNGRFVVVARAPGDPAQTVSQESTQE